MKGHFSFLLAVVALFVGMESAAQQLAKPQATLIYSIVRLVDWPELYKDQTFVIGVVGDKMDITRELRAGKGDRTVRGKEIEIVEYASIKEVGKCHLLFVPNEHLNSFTKSGTNLSGQPILVMTESSYRHPDISVINFSVVDGKLGITLNEENAKSRKLGLSKQLINFAR